MTEQLLEVQIDSGMAFITLNRPHVRNAISMEMVDELDRLLDELKNDLETKVIIFTGSGDKAFVSGGDLQLFLAAREKESSKPMLMKVGKLLSKIQQFPKPTIAMINGAAIGGGCEFATACDFRIASDQARLGFVQIGMHITTGWGSGARLVRKVGRTNALTLLLTGQIMNANQAMEYGFVDKVVNHSSLLQETLSFAGLIARQPLESIQAYMEMVHNLDDGMDLESAIELEIDRCSDLWGSDSHLQVGQAFLGKSKNSD
jgi:enoyl-CoA hydratase/carnithine racemase